MSFINWGHETPEQKELRKRLEEQALFQQTISKKIFEQRAAANAASPAGATGSGGGDIPSKNQKLVEALSWGFWAPGGSGSDGDDYASFDYWTTDTFPAVSNVSRLVLFTGAGANAHLHEGGDAYTDIKIELYDNSKDSWVRVWSKRLKNTDDYYFNVDVDFPTITEVTQIRMSSDPEQGQTYHSWEGATFELYQFGEQSTDLQLVWADIAETPVADPTSVSDWNDYFGISYFTNVSVAGNIVNLTPSGLVQVSSNLFSPGKSGNQYLIEVIDNANCVTEINDQAFSNCDLLTKVILPACTHLRFAAFESCSYLTTIDFSSVIEIEDLSLGELNSLASISLPELTLADTSAIYGNGSIKSFYAPKLQAVGNYFFNDCYNLEIVYLPLCISLGEDTATNNVFTNIDSKPFTLTVDSSLATCNAGAPDGDITQLVADMIPETVTINYIQNTI